MSKKNMTFSDLAWEDLTQWAGPKIVPRGKSYKTQVQDLCVTATGGLLAWVRGTERYITLVEMTPDNMLLGQCTCPYSWGPCKHAVAVILLYLDQLKLQKPVPKAKPNDRRLRHLGETGSDCGNNRDDCDSPDKALRKYLDGLSKETLTALILEILTHHPEAREMVSDRVQLQEGTTEQIIESLRGDIEDLSSEPGWSNHWSNEGHTPDYSNVRLRLEALLEAGHADQVVSLGEDLLRLGMEQVSQSDDEGETGVEIASCMEVVFEAVGGSSLTPAEKILWEIDAFLEDDYSILDGVEGSASLPDDSKDDWSKVADELNRRMEEMPAPTGEKDSDSHSRRYRRQRLMRFLIDALENAGRKSEAIPLLEREAPVTQCYGELVSRLMSARQKKEAAEWATKGFVETIGRWDGIAWDMEARLREMAEREKDQPLVAAYRAIEFLDKPDIARYAVLEKAAKKIKVWPDVRAAVLHYLETGQRPDLPPPKAASPTAKRKKTAKKKSAKSPKQTPSNPWPLPPTGLPISSKKNASREFPYTGILIDIAIEEKRNDDALKWHAKAKQTRGLWGGSNDEKIAEAVQRTHPDVALGIWKQLADSRIAQVQVGAYEDAGRYLRKMEKVYHREKRLAEWRTLMANLRTENKRRPRMIDVLNTLERKRTRILDA